MGHFDRKHILYLSPTLTCDTDSPISLTTPANSWPRISFLAAGKWPLIIWRSVPQTPQHLTCITTSLAFLTLGIGVVIRERAPSYNCTAVFIFRQTYRKHTMIYVDQTWNANSVEASETSNSKWLNVNYFYFVSYNLIENGLHWNTHPCIFAVTKIKSTRKILQWKVLELA